MVLRKKMTCDYANVAVDKTATTLCEPPLWAEFMLRVRCSPAPGISDQWSRRLRLQNASTGGVHAVCLAGSLRILAKSEATTQSGGDTSHPPLSVLLNDGLLARPTASRPMIMLRQDYMMSYVHGVLLLYEATFSWCMRGAISVCPRRSSPSQFSGYGGAC